MDDPLHQDMTGPAPTQDGHSLAIETPLGKDVLLLTSIDGVEAVSKGFVYTIEMLTRASDSDVRSLLAKPVTLWLRNDSEAERRPLHGHVRHLVRIAIDSRGYWLWRAEVAPWLWFLTHSVDCRIYQHLSIPEILRSVFDEHGLSDYELRLHRQYPKLDFCVQYRESALAFVSRLMEHVGIFYSFEHYPDRHLLTIGDHSTLAKFTTPREAIFNENREQGQIHEFEHSFAFLPGNWALSDFDFEHPTKNLHTLEQTVLDIAPMKRFEIFDYPGTYLERDTGKDLTRVRVEQEEARHHQLCGGGTCVGFDAGRRFTLVPPRADRTEKEETYFLTEVRHSAREAHYFANSDAMASYSNRFAAIAAETPFRPERLTPKPIVQGPQTATVVGPAGENIHTDQYGRVRVLFHWDRRGKWNEHASCWLRVSQASAGSHWGGVAIPHVGQEVIIGFLEGDPDRPIVTGRVHNGRNMPPLNLPRDKDKTILRDHGDNKLIMHGQAGKQWMSMVTPRALNLVAMRPAAKPLSADVPGGFDEGLDQDAFNEMFIVYNELAGLETSPTSSPVSTGSALGTTVSPSNHPLTGAGDYTGDSSDINTLSQGKINSLSLGNTNTWVGTDLNQEVLGSTDTVSHGTVTNTYHSQVTDNFDTFHEENTTYHNEFTGAHTEIVGVHGEITVAHVEATGVHLESNDIFHFEHQMGWHMQVGEVTEIHTKNQIIKMHEEEVKAANDQLEVINNSLKNYVTKTELTETKTSISQQLSQITAEIHSIECDVLSLDVLTCAIAADVIEMIAASIVIG